MSSFFVSYSLFICFYILIKKKLLLGSEAYWIVVAFYVYDKHSASHMVAEMIGIPGQWYLLILINPFSHIG